MYLVTGSNGMVGEAVEMVFGKKNCILTDTEELDVRYWSDVKKHLDLKVKGIIHLAAETDLEFCENNPELAYL